MPVTALKKTKKTTSKRKGASVSKRMKNLSNDPFFVKKAKAAEAFLKKHSLPASFARIK